MISEEMLIIQWKYHFMKLMSGNESIVAQKS